MSKITSGEVEIELDGTTYTLTPTLRAALTVNKSFGGFVKANDRLMQFDLEAIILSIHAGLGDKSPDGLAEKVFAAGVTKLTPVAIEFVNILANGGRRYDPTEGKPENPPTAG